LYIDRDNGKVHVQTWERRIAIFCTRAFQGIGNRPLGGWIHAKCWQSIVFLLLPFLSHLQRRGVGEKETTKKIPGSAIERNQHSCTRILEILAF